MWGHKTWLSWTSAFRSFKIVLCVRSAEHGCSRVLKYIHGYSHGFAVDSWKENANYWLDILYFLNGFMPRRQQKDEWNRQWHSSNPTVSWCATVWPLRKRIVYSLCGTRRNLAWSLLSLNYEVVESIPFTGFHQWNLIFLSIYVEWSWPNLWVLKPSGWSCEWSWQIFLQNLKRSPSLLKKILNLKKCRGV